jgi:hypothetical protein
MTAEVVTSRRADASAAAREGTSREIALRAEADPDLPSTGTRDVTPGTEEDQEATLPPAAEEASTRSVEAEEEAAAEV